MKKLITILILISSFYAAKAQYNVPRGFPITNGSYYNFQGTTNGGFVLFDSLIMMRTASSQLMRPLYPAIKYFNTGSDSGWYYSHGGYQSWIKFGTGSGGTTTFFELTDVDSSGIQDGYIPYYDQSSGNILFQGQGEVSTGNVYYAIDSLNTPPGGPSTGDVYMVGGAGTGAWSGHNYDIATWNGASWDFTDPTTGDIAVVASTKKSYKYNGSTWVITGGIPLLIGGNNLTSGLQFGALTNVATTWIINGLQRIRVTPTEIIFNRGANTYTFPSSRGSADQYLKTDGSGNLSWATVSAGSSPLFPLTGTGTATGNVTGDLGGFSLSVTNAARMTISLSDSMLIGANKFSVAALDSANIRANVFYSGAIRTTVGATTYALVGLLDSSAAIRFQNGLMYMKGTTTGTGSIARIDASTKALGYSSTISLTSEVANTLPVGNGGTGVATIPTGGIMLGAGTSPITTLVGTVTNQVPVWNGTTWTAGTVTNYWNRQQYGALASTNILQPATLSDTVAIGPTATITALSAFFNVGGTSRFWGRTSINSALNANYQLAIDGGSGTGRALIVSGQTRIDERLAVNTSADPATGVALGVTGSTVAAIYSLGTSGAAGSTMLQNQFYVGNQSGAATNSQTAVYVNVSNNSDASSVQTAALYRGVSVQVQTKSNSTTPVTVATGYDFELGVVNSRTQTFTTAYGFWAKPISTTTQLITTGGNYYGFLADSSLAATYTGSSAWGFFQRNNTAKTIKNKLEGNTLIGAGTQDASAALEVISTTQGVLMPRMTATQASAITGVNGLIVYVTDTNGTFTSAGFWGYQAGAWAKL